MLEGDPQPLAIASTVLAPATVSALRRHPYHLVGWRIADRWAFQQPERLRALEADGEVLVLIRVLEQQQLEHEALIDALDEPHAGLSPTDILQQRGIDLRL
ncbi:hypothetical protein QZM46_23490 [Burkholderia vietnamiensis]|uniref:hypothetical protein n=1 Tax=Burkholderia vietnamiensis TaxID=60552 RepID=UPI002656E2C1|nr:hypothetical protein [Burkholderia vietnamiensis]MDN7554282.1 hypothetical protein [Burkholderia vietnamiensis]HDR9092002.1 hypothetical protein [Burkholderia vietnamiensis]